MASIPYHDRLEQYVKEHTSEFPNLDGTYSFLVCRAVAAHESYLYTREDLYRLLLNGCEPMTPVQAERLLRSWVECFGEDSTFKTIVRIMRHLPTNTAFAES